MENNELLQAIRNIVKEELEPLKQGQEELKTDVAELKDMFRNLEATNAQNHLKIYKAIDDLKVEVKDLKDELTQVEIVTANNWKEISKLKLIK